MFSDYGNHDLPCSYFSITPAYLMVVGSISGLLPNILSITLYCFIFFTALKVNKSIFEDNRNKTRNHFTPEGKIVNVSNAINNLTVFEEKRSKKGFPNVNVIDKSNPVENNNNKMINITKPEENIKKDNFTFLGNNQHNFHQFRQNLKNHISFNDNQDILNKTYSKGLLKGKSIMMVLFVTSTFTMVWGPCFACIMIYAIACKDIDRPDICWHIEDILYIIMFNLGLVNALLNPIIYCWWHKGFRKALMKLCCKKMIREKRRNDFVAALKNQDKLKKENDNNNFGQLCL